MRTCLDLRGCRIGDAGLRALLRPGSFPALSFLDLEANGLTRDASRVFLAWERLPHLAKLEAPFFADSDARPGRLAHSPALPAS